MAENLLDGSRDVLPEGLFVETRVETPQAVGPPRDRQPTTTRAERPQYLQKEVRLPSRDIDERLREPRVIGLEVVAGKGRLDELLHLAHVEARQDAPVHPDPLTAQVREGSLQTLDTIRGGRGRVRVEPRAQEQQGHPRLPCRAQGVDQDVPGLALAVVEIVEDQDDGSAGRQGAVEARPALV
jgi:hypothetical protein